MEIKANFFLLRILNVFDQCGWSNGWIRVLREIYETSNRFPINPLDRSRLTVDKIEIPMVVIIIDSSSKIFLKYGSNYILICTVRPKCGWKYKQWIYKILSFYFFGSVALVESLYSLAQNIQIISRISIVSYCSDTANQLEQSSKR